MNIKFVIIGLVIIAALWFGNEHYSAKKFQEQVRNGLKNIKIDAQMENEMKRSGLPLKMDILNHYPKITHYYDIDVLLPSEQAQQIRTQMQQEINEQPCRYINNHPNLTNDTKYHDYYNAYKTVLEEDNVSMTIIVRDKNKQKIAEATQELAKCSVFLTPPKS